MRTFVKNIFNDLHINPINRDLVLVMVSGLLAALAIETGNRELILVSSNLRSCRNPFFAVFKNLLFPYWHFRLEFVDNEFAGVK